MTHRYVTWLVEMSHDSFICDMTRWYVTWRVDMWRDSYVTWLVHMWQDSLICDMTYWYVTWLIDMWHDSMRCNKTRWDVTRLVHVWDDDGYGGGREDSGTGWRRLIGSPKLQIIFRKRAIKYRSLLRKMTCKDKGSYESSPPCSNMWYESCHM